MAHEKGRHEGALEERQNRDEKIKDILENISQNFSSLFAAEIYRERQYEEESLQLALAVLDELAPPLQKHLGKKTLETIIADTLKSHSKTSEICIEVAPENTEDISQALESIWADKEEAPRYKVIGKDELSSGACHILWQDGGMIRNPQKTASQIKKQIESLLQDAISSRKEEKTEENTNSELTEEENNAIKEEERPLSDKQPPADAPSSSVAIMDKNGEKNE